MHDEVIDARMVANEIANNNAQKWLCKVTIKSHQMLHNHFCFHLCKIALNFAQNCFETVRM